MVGNDSSIDTWDVSSDLVTSTILVRTTGTCIVRKRQQVHVIAVRESVTFFFLDLLRLVHLVNHTTSFN